MAFWMEFASMLMPVVMNTDWTAGHSRTKRGFWRFEKFKETDLASSVRSES